MEEIIFSNSISDVGLVPETTDDEDRDDHEEIIKNTEEAI